MKLIYKDKKLHEILNSEGEPIKFFTVDEQELSTTINPVNDICDVDNNFITIDELIRDYGDISTGYSIVNIGGNYGNIFAYNRTAIEAKAKTYTDSIKTSRMWHGLSHLLGSEYQYVDVTNLTSIHFDTFIIQYRWQDATQDRWSFALNDKLKQQKAKRANRKPPKIYKHNRTKAEYYREWEILTESINCALAERGFPMTIKYKSGKVMVEVIKLIKKLGITSDDVISSSRWYYNKKEEADLQIKMFNSPSRYIIPKKGE